MASLRFGAGEVSHGQIRRRKPKLCGENCEIRGSRWIVKALDEGYSPGTLAGVGILSSNVRIAASDFVMNEVIDTA